MQNETSLLLADPKKPVERVTLADWVELRPFQSETVENTVGLFDAGQIGVLHRLFTGAGKTIVACMVIADWLARSDRHRAIIVCHERQLVWQFAQEIEDVLGIMPGIEMAGRGVPVDRKPLVTVASRATLDARKTAAPKQLKDLSGHGLERFGVLTKVLAKKLLCAAQRGVKKERLQRAIDRHNESWRANHREGKFSRLYKFDPMEHAWLVVYDEAHKHAHSLSSVRHNADWFSQNPENRRLGMTATPKRSDGVSLGDKMFPPLPSIIRCSASTPPAP